MSIVTLDKKNILVTGAAGFIGSNLVKRGSSGADKAWYYCQCNWTGTGCYEYAGKK